MTKLLLTILLILSPLTILPTKTTKKYISKTKKHMVHKKRTKRQSLQDEQLKETKKKNIITVLCTPKVIETSATFILTTAQIIAIILTLIIH